MPITNPPDDTGAPGQPVSDVVSVQGVPGGYPVAVTGSLAAPASSGAAETAFSASLSNQTLAPSNASRIGVTVFLDLASEGHLFLRASALPATTASYTTMLWPGSYWEAPYGYTGQVNGVFDTLTGSCLVTAFS